MKPAISVHNLSKKYRLGVAATKDNNLTENLRYHAKNAWDKIHRLVHPKKDLHHDESFWALKDVSFEVQPGEVVGIIGRNGAGKSTLLKVLSQIVEPTSGHAIVRGRLGSLLEVGTGFHPELTGRENIYMNGAILGMTRQEINRKFDEIVEFAEVEKFLDTPVKRYSSGMYVRLAFSVAAHLEPEILIVDEVLAVGDSEFQKKCQNKMKEVRDGGRTVLLVSHHMNAIKSLCRNAIVMDSGSLMVYGPVSEAIDYYNKSVPHRAKVLVDEMCISTGTDKNIIKQIDVYDLNRTNTCSFKPEDYVSISLKISVGNDIISPRISIGMNNSMGERVCAIASYLSGTSLQRISNASIVSCEFRLPALVPGDYIFDIGISDGRGPFLHAIYSACAIEVVEANYLQTTHPYFPEMGNIMVRSKWSMSEYSNADNGIY